MQDFWSQLTPVSRAWLPQVSKLLSNLVAIQLGIQTATETGAFAFFHSRLMQVLRLG